MTPMVRLITVTQAADRMQCSTSHIRALMRAAEIQQQVTKQERTPDTVPPRLRPLMELGFPRPIRLSRAGRMVRIPEDELDTWLRAA